MAVHYLLIAFSLLNVVTWDIGVSSEPRDSNDLKVLVVVNFHLHLETNAPLSPRRRRLLKIDRADIDKRF